MKSNTLTIIRKEFTRFFKDRQLLFSTVIMPGLLIYLIYSLMGSGIESMVNAGDDERTTVTVENMPESVRFIFDEMDGTVTLIEHAVSQEEIDLLEDKDLNMVMVRFPVAFDSLKDNYNPGDGMQAPNVEIYYNAVNKASSGVYETISGALSAYEERVCNQFDVNRMDGNTQTYNKATEDQMFGDIWGKILPMIIMMMLFTGTMAIAPSSIAGEKERGTIATLLVTPLRRNELALGKIISLSCIALLSGISSFVGIALSLPKMMRGDMEGVELGFNYSIGDYMAILVTIFATVLVMAAVVSLISALAKDVKNAGTMIAPLMLVVTLAGFIPMFQSGPATDVYVYLIPFYNSVEALVSVFSHEMHWMNVLVAVASNVVYTAVATWGLTRMFNSEKVMFGR